MDLNQTEFFQNPYPFYEQIRLSDKPFWLAHKQDTLKNKGVWLFANYADALQIFKSNQFSKNIINQRTEGIATCFDLHLLHRDPPDHERLRRLIMPYFSVVAMSQLEAIMEKITHELIDALLQQPEIDFMADFAELLPLNVIAHMMGLPKSDMPKIRQWSLDIGNGFDSIIGSDQVHAAQRQALGAYLDYVKAAIRTKRNHPGTDIISALNQAHEQALISEDELTGMIGFLLFAGHETTINLIGNGMHTLLQHQTQWQLLKDNPQLIDSAIEEILRFESPEQGSSFRMLKQAMVIGGHEIAAGEQVGVIIGAANRDSVAFSKAHEFDITRTANKHIAFGSGAHQCLGLHMAKLEAKVAITAIVQRIPNIQLLQMQPNWRHNSFFRGLETLPASLS
jgi:cytochrome P450